MVRERSAKERLLRTASDLIWESSYGSVGVEQICERAGVQKGSFYHFFPSKSDLAVAAIETHWEENRPDKERVFADDVPPLRRFIGWCGLIRSRQRARREKHGKVLGCPYSSMGSELSTRDENIRRKCQEMADRTCAFVETAVRAAQRESLIPRGNAGEKARELYSFVSGVVLQARIDNDLGGLDRLEPGVFRLLGVREPARR
ncbi:MAG TPA: TetR/AcrR family transcriptional regulator [Elusimicrobiota bacterium]|jgi:TetR/AcrR family transcriptional repressor of nem operon|nr:TetR/AcrR family transcriptional regulator [Elusimicrobiota bacterium]